MSGPESVTTDSTTMASESSAAASSTSIASWSGNGHPIQTSEAKTTTNSKNHPTKSKTWSSGAPEQTSETTTSTLAASSDTTTYMGSMSTTASSMPIYSISSAAAMNNTSTLPVCPGVTATVSVITITNTVVETVTGFPPPSSASSWGEAKPTDKKNVWASW